jgi:hypothetical protein
MNILEMHEKATEAAIKATNEFIREHGETPYCGFAWVKIYADGRSKFGKELIKSGVASKAWDSGYDVWNPSKNSTQSMDAKEQGAMAYAEVMRANGVKAYAQSRAD